MIDMDDDARETVIGATLVVGFIMIIVIAVVTGCLGCYYIKENTKCEYIKHGYVERWNPMLQRMEWIRSDVVSHHE